MKRHNPPAVAGPFAAYSHGIEVPPNARWLSISGQVAVEKDGSVPAGIEAQTAVVFRNLDAVLASAGMGKEDIVKMTMFITRPENVQPFRTLRDQWLGDARPSTTLVVVAGLVSPDWLVEVEIYAAQAVGSEEGATLGSEPRAPQGGTATGFERGREG
jgi:2-iminobutanoate/2-iminopropanoate deaminase